MKTVDELLSLLTLEEKVALVSGHNFMYTNPVSRLDIPSIRMSDGPHGLRVQDDDQGDNVTASKVATAFPTASASVNSWNPFLLEKMGEAMAEEATYYGINVILGPGVCIKRNPLCGRNFEYFSEDPYLAGVMGAAEVKGIQSKGVSACVKHYALNNLENFRFMGDSIADKRAMREIYLRQFEYIVKNAKPDTMMSSYNSVNGTFASENKYLLTELLRDEWKFGGLIMTDWGGNKDRVLGVKAGQDLEMPGDTAICRKWLFDAVNNGTLDIKDLDLAVKHVLELVYKHHNKEKAKEVDFAAHHELAKKIALESAVLLKNDGTLPLKQDDKLLVVGDLFNRFRYQGAGSSLITPHSLFTPKDAFDNNKVNYKFVRGYQYKDFEPDYELIKEAVEASKDYEKIVLFLGLTDYTETEGGDRENMSLPNSQLALIEELAKLGKEINVVLFGGASIELPFIDKVNSILNMFLSGQNGGSALYELLFGLVNPSGKLGETWPLSYKDVPFGDKFSKTVQEVYKESIYVGYRYYLTKEKPVRFPFGFGLSYTTFEYSDLVVKQNKNDISVTLNVTNTGDRDGDEIVQVYVASPDKNMFKPLRELKGFTKVHLASKETKAVEILIENESLKSFALKENRFVLENGKYVIEVGKNSQDIVLKEEVEIKGETIKPQYSKEVREAYESSNIENISNELFEEVLGYKIPALPPLKPITLESPFADLRHTFFGRILLNAIVKTSKKPYKNADKLPDGPEKENQIKSAFAIEKMMLSSSLRSLSMSAGTRFPYNFAQGFVDLSNNKFFKGIGDFIKKIDAPALPIDNKEVK